MLENSTGPERLKIQSASQVVGSGCQDGKKGSQIGLHLTSRVE